MSPDWGSLPLLPLKCILEHLSTEDALAAMSTCRHWRSSILIYEGCRETLRLRAKNLEKSLYLARLFRKHTRRVHLYLDGTENECDDFMDYVLPLFFDSAKLRELIFIGPSCIQETQHMPVIKIKRILTESLLYKHVRTLQRFGMLSCEMGVAKGENDKIAHKNLEFYSRPLSFCREALPDDAVLSRCNNGMMLSALNSVIVDYPQMSTSLLEQLVSLQSFEHLTLNVGCRRVRAHARLDWPRLRAAGRAPRVSVNIISLPHTKFDEVIENVLCAGMPLVSLKVLFCRSLYPPLIEHLLAVHKETLEELVWADCPYNSRDVFDRHQPPVRLTQYGIGNVNPFMLLCWQCTRLRRLVIHGYWIWQYDLLGFVRLRNSLRVEVSAIHERPNAFGEATARVLVCDEPARPHPQFVQEMNDYTKLKWSWRPWSQLHPGLRARASPPQRAAALRQELLADA